MARINQGVRVWRVSHAISISFGYSCKNKIRPFLVDGRLVYPATLVKQIAEESEAVSNVVDRSLHSLRDKIGHDLVPKLIRTILDVSDLLRG